MKLRELALELMVIDGKIDLFVSDLQALGINCEQSVMADIEIPTLVAKMLGVDTDNEEKLDAVWETYASVKRTEASYAGFIETVATLA